MIKGTILSLDTANDYYDQNQFKDIAKEGLVTETTFNLDSLQHRIINTSY